MEDGEDSNYSHDSLSALSIILKDHGLYEAFRKIVDLGEIYPPEKLCAAIGKVIYDGDGLAFIEIRDRILEDGLKSLIGDYVHLILAGLLINGKFSERIDMLRELITFLGPKKSSYCYSFQELISLCTLPLLVVCLKYSGHPIQGIRRQVMNHK